LVFARGETGLVMSKSWPLRCAGWRVCRRDGAWCLRQRGGRLTLALDHITQRDFWSRAREDGQRVSPNGRGYEDSTRLHWRDRGDGRLIGTWSCGPVSVRT